MKPLLLDVKNFERYSDFNWELKNWCRSELIPQIPLSERGQEFVEMCEVVFDTDSAFFQYEHWTEPCLEAIAPYVQAAGMRIEYVKEKLVQIIYRSEDRESLGVG